MNLSLAIRKSFNAANPPVVVREAIKRGLLLWRMPTSGSRILPDFLIIGGQKCGTTSLYYNLVSHPCVIPSLFKEIRYFDINYRKGEYWYRAHFPSKQGMDLAGGSQGDRVVTGEASPSYIFNPHAPRRIKELLPDVRLILMLRNPVDRAYSHYYHSVRYWGEKLSFADAVEQEAERLNGEYEKLLNDENYHSRNRIRYSYTTRGIYANQLACWLEIFTLSQILILKSEDYKSHPEGTYRRVFDSLGLPEWKVPYSRDYNIAKYPPMDPVIKERLYEFFEPHNKRLYELVGRDFRWEEEC